MTSMALSESGACCRPAVPAYAEKDSTAMKASIAAAFLLCGAYRNLPVFWETFAMPVRSAYVVENGFAAAEGAVIALAAAVLAAVIGTVCFKRKNILRTEG